MLFLYADITNAFYFYRSIPLSRIDSTAWLVDGVAVLVCATVKIDASRLGRAVPCALVHRPQCGDTAVQLASCWRASEMLRAYPGLLGQ